MAVVNILFLSDLHFTKQDDIYARNLEECASTYIEEVSNIDVSWKPQIIAIAGDIGFSGVADEYEFFDEKFLSPLLDKLKIQSDHVIMCPGNHDKDDTKIPYYNSESASRSWIEIEEIEKLPYKAMVFNGYRSNCNIQRFTLDQFTIAPFQNYINYLKKKGIPAFDTTKFDYDGSDDAEYLYGYRSIDGIDFYCYNSAWDCLHNDKRDKGNLRIGPVCRRNDKVDKNILSISLVHHPQDWLSIEAVSNIRFRKEIIADCSDIVVHGHMHFADIHQDENCNVVYVQLPTWSSPDTDLKNWKSYILRINLDDFTYSKMPIFWYRDNGNTYPVKFEISEEYDLHLSQKFEFEVQKNSAIMEDLYRTLMNCFERMQIQPSREYLHTILELIEIIISKSVKFALSDNNKELLEQFYNKAEKAVEEDTISKDIYEELLEDVKELHNNLVPGISNILTRHTGLN